MFRFITIFIVVSALFVGALTVSQRSAQAAMSDYPRVKLQSLDKITARTMSFEARVGSTIKFGPLYIKVRACRKSDPMDQPESAAFLQIWEVDSNGQAAWVFSGWMFASSPALSPMDHPVYDVWVLDCPGEALQSEEPDPDDQDILRIDEQSGPENAGDGPEPEIVRDAVPPG